MRRTRVVIVEDNRLFRETSELLELREEIDVVGSVEGGAEAVELCRDLGSDVVLMDYRLEPG